MIYVAFFRTGGAFAFADIEAETAEAALAEAHAIAERGDRLHFYFYKAANRIHEIEIFAQSRSPLALWRDDILALRCAAGGLLKAARELFLSCTDRLSEGVGMLTGGAFGQAEHDDPSGFGPEGRPNWTFMIDRFDAIEVHPCRTCGHDLGVEVIEQCEPEEAEFWSAYGHLLTGGLDCLEDFPTELEAEGFAATLRRAYPHLAEG